MYLLSSLVAVLAVLVDAADGDTVDPWPRSPLVPVDRSPAKTLPGGRVRKLERIVRASTSESIAAWVCRIQIVFEE